MRPTVPLPRRCVVAKYSVVRKLGAFHLMPSAMAGSAPRRISRRSPISALNGWSSAAMKASTAADESGEGASAPPLGFAVATIAAYPGITGSTSCASSVSDSCHPR